MSVMPPPISELSFDQAKDIFVQLKSRRAELIESSCEVPFVQQMKRVLAQIGEQGRLDLPDMRALHNNSIGVFTDYGGDHKSSDYYTYSVFVCALGSRAHFEKRMKELRKLHALGLGKIEYKDFARGQVKRILPHYFETLSYCMPGLLFTVGISKKIRTLFSENSAAGLQDVAGKLHELGFGDRGKKGAEKTLRVAHIVALAMALLVEDGQKVLWYCDRDEIVATPELFKQLTDLTRTQLYGHRSNLSLSLFGTAIEFEEKSISPLNLVDLLSVADVSAGTVAELMTRYARKRMNEATKKPGLAESLQWHGANSLIGTKKIVLIVEPSADGKSYLAGEFRIQATELPEKLKIGPIFYY
jgi:hypothetical protein